MRSTRTFIKRTIGSATFVAAMTIAFVPAASAQTADEGAQIYSDKCTRCHQADGLGLPGKFPPLVGNPNAGDIAHVVDIVTNGMVGVELLGQSWSGEMRPFEGKLTPEQIQAVSAFAVELSTTGAAFVPPATTPAGEGTAAAGAAIFNGSQPLSGGGSACIACHAAGTYDRLGGPGMGMDLNGIVADYGKAGFMDSIMAPVVDPMIAVFGTQLITAQEAADLAAFLETTTAADAGGSGIDLFPIYGLIGFAVLMLITAFAVRGPQETYVTKLRSTR